MKRRKSNVVAKFGIYATVLAQPPESAHLPNLKEEENPS
jgi:hypothetical protein